LKKMSLKLLQILQFGLINRSKRRKTEHNRTLSEKIDELKKILQMDVQIESIQSVSIIPYYKGKHKDRLIPDIKYFKITGDTECVKHEGK